MKVLAFALLGDAFRFSSFSGRLASGVQDLIAAAVERTVAQARTPR